MPSYNPTAKYDIPHLNLVSVLYRPFKTNMNPRNRGFWDLKLTGQYHQGIIAKIKKGEVTFHQKFRNKKITWLHDVLRENKLNPLGITQKQWEELQMKNSEAIREKIQQIING